jgi:beta-glucosidase
VNCSGSAIALQPESAVCDAIVQAWYAREQGGTAIAEILYGDVNPSGKLPVTFYKNSSQLPDFEDYSMKGRTYRYFNDALFPFGFGLSYTTFQIGSPSYNDGKLSVEVSNTGKREGTEVVQLYLKYLADADGPSKSLRGFQRINLKAGEHKTVTFSLKSEDFEWFDEQTNTMRPLEGEWCLMVGNSSNDKDLKRVTIKR